MPTYHGRVKKRFEPVPWGEISPYVMAAKDDDKRYVIALSWLSGMRISEIVKLRKQDIIIDEDAKELTVTNESLKKGKTGYPSFSFDDPFVGELVQFFKGAGEKVFSRGKRCYQLELARINREIHGDESRWVTYHYLRHGRISFLARVLRASPEEIKSWTGHRSSAFEEYFQPRKVDRFRGKIR